MAGSDLVEVRTPTYRRPEMLRRALQSLVNQTHQNWKCSVRDDDPDRAGQAVVSKLGDPRISYHHNSPQLFASRNIDQCFSSESPNGAQFFCVVEDDNYLMPDFMAANIETCRRQGVEIVLRNQLVERASGTPEASLSETGVLDELLVDRTYLPEEFHLSLLAGIGVSNGGLFWSRDAISRLEVGYACTATLQEYLRTYSISEKIHVAMHPLAVWAENADQTTRNNEISASYLRREIDLKRAIQRLQQLTWAATAPRMRSRFLEDTNFSASAETRARGLAKALIMAPTGAALSQREKMILRAKGVMIALFGRTTDDFARFLTSRHVQGV